MYFRLLRNLSMFVLLFMLGSELNKYIRAMELCCVFSTVRSRDSEPESPLVPRDTAFVAKR